jgi:hypothetical protein
MICKIHGETPHAARKGGGWRCKKCAVEAVSRRRKKVLDTLIEEAGGCCIRCGYRKNSAALHFHHRNPKEKSFGISMKGITRSLDRLREESSKCDLLCANCHAEVEYPHRSI